eukprot:749927-Hanusia_phi.AAC.11
MVVRDRADGLVLIDVVRSQRQRKISTELHGKQQRRSEGGERERRAKRAEEAQEETRWDGGDRLGQDRIRLPTHLEVEDSRRGPGGAADGVAGQVGEAGGGEVVLGDVDVGTLVHHVVAGRTFGQPGAGVEADGVVGVSEGAEGSQPSDHGVSLHVGAEAHGVAVAEEGDGGLVDIHEEAEGVVGHERLSRALHPHAPHPDLPGRGVAPGRDLPREHARVGGVCRSRAEAEHEEG